MRSQLIETLEPRRLFVIDLVCMSATVDSYDASTGMLTYSTVFTNTGAAQVPVDTFNNVFLTQDDVVNNADDVSIGSIANRLIPSTGSLKKVTAGTTVHNIAAGTYYLVVAFDANNTVTEPDNLNNYRFSSTKITIPEKYNIVVEGTGAKDAIIARQTETNVIVTLNATTVWDIQTKRVASIVLRGQAADDTISAALMRIPVVVEGGDGKDTIRGGEGADTLSGGTGPDSIDGNGGNDRINGNGGNDRLYGLSGADRIYGYAGNDLLDGGSSNDRLDGSTGNDTMYGQGGDDRFFAKDAAIDQLFGGSGVDTAQRDSIDITQSIV